MRAIFKTPSRIVTGNESPFPEKDPVHQPKKILHYGAGFLISIDLFRRL
jgi:hypothetical protein